MCSDRTVPFSVGSDGLLLHVRLTPKSGRYASAEDVMRDSLRLLEQREQTLVAQIASLQSDIADGLASGPSEPLDMAEIKHAARLMSPQDAP